MTSFYAVPREIAGFYPELAQESLAECAKYLLSYHYVKKFKIDILVLKDSKDFMYH